MHAERHVVAFLVRPDRPIERLDLGPDAPIATAVDRWRATYVADRPALGTGRADPAVELRRLVWQPLERRLDGVRAVLVSPDGSLACFPLATLPGKRPGTYLIEELSIALIPVPQLLPQLLSRGREPLTASGPSPSLLLMGDIDFGARSGPSPSPLAEPARPVSTRSGRIADFQPLPSTTREMGDVRAMFVQTNPGAAVNEVHGKAATEAVLRGQGPACATCIWRRTASLRDPS